MIGAARYSTLWLCGRLFATPGYPPLSRSELAAALSPYDALPRSSQRVIAFRTAALGSLMRRADAFLPSEGAILDAGCGHGQMARWLAREPGRQVLGVDSSESRIRAARGAEMPPNLRFERASMHDAIASDGPCWDGFVFVDALLYIDVEAQRDVLIATREAARPGALLLIKDSIAEPRWKLRLTRMEERIKLGRAYYGNAPGGPLTYRPREEWVATLHDAGWRVTDDCRTPRFLPYPGWIAVCHAV